MYIKKIIKSGVSKLLLTSRGLCLTSNLTLHFVLLSASIISDARAQNILAYNVDICNVDQTTLLISQKNKGWLHFN